MAKLTEFQTPTGAKGNILDPSSWVQMILGSAVLFLTLAIGQNVANRASGKAPFLDSRMDQPWDTPQPTVKKDSVEVL